MLNAQVNIANSVSINLSINHIALIVTIAAIATGILVPNEVLEKGGTYFVLLLLLAGILHGASDYFMYKSLATKQLAVHEKVRFYAVYILTIIAYAVIWYFFPLVALLLFIGISIYHFGQSNWHQYQIRKLRLARVTYIAWGSFVTLVPLICHFDDALLIIQEIVDIDLTFPSEYRIVVHTFLFSINILLIFYLRVRNHLENKAFIQENINLFILYLLFLFTPLLIGFAIYFAFWHSTYATVEQINILKEKVKNFDLYGYGKSLLIMSSLAFIGVGLMYYLYVDVFDDYFGWGMFFLFVSLITLPHSFVIEKLYELKINNTNN